MKKLGKIKRIISLAVSIVLIISSLTACAKNEAKAGDTTGTPKADGKELRTIRVAFMTGQTDHYAAVIGQEEGIYEKHGIKIEATEYAYGINTIDAIANGTGDVGMCADFAGVNRIGNTLDYNQLVFYAELAVSNATTGGLYVAPEYADDLSKLEDSAGWITSIGTRSEYSNWYAQTALGLDPDKQKIVNTDSTATALAAATNGEASAVVSSGSQAKKYEGLGWVLVATSDQVSASTGSYLVTSKQYIEANADILADYLAAIDESVKYINDHLDDVANRLSAKLGVDPENFKSDWKTPKIVIGFTEEGVQNLESIANWAADHGKFEKKYNVRDFIITTAVEKAFPDRVTIKK
ncbi:MAG: ABC transporter substrate-binding protein [Lachnospiraceae bacterium]|nr:ABC transporter substrate-binding protein [Lachnospiraceae bacterium]